MNKEYQWKKYMDSGIEAIVTANSPSGVNHFSNQFRGRMLKLQQKDEDWAWEQLKEYCSTYIDVMRDMRTAYNYRKKDREVFKYE